MHSMTGFGRARVSRDGQFVSVEVKTVNNRHLDISVSVPGDPLLEQSIKDRVKNRLDRGNVDVYIESNVLERETESIDVDRELVKDYVSITDELAEAHTEVDEEIDVVDLLDLPGVLSLREDPDVDESVESMLMTALNEALDDVIEMRRAEGEELRSDLRERILSIRDSLDRIEERFPKALEGYRERLRERFQEVLSLDEPELTEELEDEITRYADKCDISEEIVRVRSHVNQFLEYLDDEGPVGKNLKFLLQELQREINTIGAKGNDADISQTTVEMKTQLEKCREQVRNVE